MLYQNKFKFNFLQLLIWFTLWLAITQPTTSANQTQITRDTFAEITEEASPAVVQLNVIRKQEEQEDSFTNQTEPFYNKDFNEDDGVGTGFIINEDGYILTNQHLVDNATEVSVFIKGYEEKFKAEKIGSDFNLDLALLKVDTAQQLPKLELGDSNTIRPGDWVLTIGNPYNLSHTVTFGIISAIDRPLKIKENNQTRIYNNLIQTDAAINPGNSGGPLLDIDGQVIGVNTAINNEGQGIGFAIPINEAKEIIFQLKEHGQVIRPWIGVYMQKINENMIDYFNLEQTTGTLVAEIATASPAEQAGLKVGDIITKINDIKVDHPKKAFAIIENLELNQEVTLEIIREGEVKELNPKVTKKPR
ncbi:trypsin-like peptidase domain-containing protein [Natroniella sulfidigena]|uniref:S1C family serine protease n=1 Tax=Natroniella sulfidigena TaxID=723921 RepID=UPI00200B704C|nr:trypsin-like peptidase domain-containing protein [Natroniella sulfidigena]MCK8816990.1 trypsin-like peptidase domain-containing protein [Natroniella sulfidigena]